MGTGITGAREKLDSIVSNSKVNVLTVLQGIESEFKQRKDIIAKPSAIDYKVFDKGITMQIPSIDDISLNLTKHSEGQLYTKTGIPKQYGQSLIEHNLYNLLERNLKEMTQVKCEEGLLLRRIGTTAKGILSPSYKRMDATPVFETFTDTSMKAGYIPYQAFNTDYRYQLRFIFPEVFEPANGEYVVYGLSITTGDYGGQALEIEMMVLRIWCTNLAIGYDVFRKIHLGKRFTSNENILNLSEKTYALDSATIASAVGDVVKNSKKFITETNNHITESVNKEIDIKTALISLKKKGMSKEMVERVKTLYENESPIELLPTQKGLWRLSNVMSLIAQDSSLTADETIDMQKQSMNVLLQGTLN